MSHLTNLAFFHAKPGQAEALGKALQNLVEPNRSDANLRSNTRLVPTGCSLQILLDQAFIVGLGDRGQC
jgi:hypothetical protein